MKKWLSILAALAIAVSGLAWSMMVGIFGTEAAFADTETSTVTAKFKPDNIDTRGMEFALYKVGTVVNNEFVLDEPYSGAGVDMDFSKETSEADMMASASTLYGYIKSQGLKPTEQPRNPDANGKMVFTLEKRVLYLIASDEQLENGNSIYSAQPMFIWFIENDALRLL